MNKRSFLSGIVIGAGAVISLIALFIYFLPELYLYSENRNFKNTRKKSELDCNAMPLHCLVEEGEPDDINNYIQRGGSLELKDNWGQSALLWALRNNKGSSVPILLHAGANPNTKDENGTSILYQAIVLENYDIADSLLQNGVDINLLSGNEYPETPLHFCVMRNRLDCVQYLLRKGASKYLQDSFGYTVFDRLKTHTRISKEIAEVLKK